MPFPLSWASALDGTSTGGEVLIGTSIECEDMRIKIQDVPELRRDKEVEGRGAKSPSIADRSGATNFTSTEDSFLRMLLGPDERPIEGWAKTASVQPHLGTGATLIFFLFMARRRASSLSGFIVA